MNGNGATLSLQPPAAGAAPLGLLEDDRLARIAHKGDSRAFAAIYELHHQALYRYCMSILRDPEDASDALQSTMLNALRSLRKRDRALAVRPWLFRIAHNESISLLRRRRTHEEIHETADELGYVDDHDNATRGRLRQLVADLRELSERQRSALVMRELSGLEYGEIGAALGISKGAAKQTVYEARVALHARVEGREMDCDLIKRSISDGDGRKLRGRKVRAHLTACDGCRDFEALIGERRTALAALAPPLPVVASAAMLHGLAGASGGASSAAASGAVSGAGIAASSTGAKSAAIVLALVAGGGAVVATGGAGHPSGGSVSPQVRQVQTSKASAPKAFGAHGAATRAGRAATHDRAAAGAHRARSGDAASRRADGGSISHAAPASDSAANSSHAAPASGGSQSQDAAPLGGDVQAQVQQTTQQVQEQLPQVPDVQVPPPPVEVPSVPQVPSVGGSSGG